MDSTSDLSLPMSGSRLLSESSLTSNTGPGGDDLSLSELSLSDQPISLPPFSILGNHNASDISTPTRRADAGENDHLADDNDENEPAPDQTVRAPAKNREDKLRSDLFILKRLNAAFSSFNEALEATGTANDRIADQLAQTDELLNKYVGILSRSEDFTRLILDEQWQGAMADEEALDREQREEEERLRREAEQKALAEQKAQERAMREAKEREERDERERRERERNEKAIRGTIRGVRGTRASMRGQVTRGASSSRGAATTAQSGLRRPSSAAGTRPSSGAPTRGTARRS